jgi:hypothetical protein
MDDLLARYSLEEVCALQWQRCVENAAEDFAKISGDRWIEVGYEDFVQDPSKNLQRIVDLLDLEVPPEALSDAVAHVSSQSIGKGRKALDSKTTEQLMPIIQHTMTRYGYVV